MEISLQPIVLNLPEDYEGKVIATLISTREAEENSPAGVLYIHGFADYFFQEHLAACAHRHGLRFFALDLRKCGRSRLPFQHFNYCRELSEYYPEIDKSILFMHSQGVQHLFLMGHSTGGLTAALYAKEGLHKKRITGLILNSPFLEFNLSRLQRQVILPLTAMLGEIFPFARITLPAFPVYTKTLHQSAAGEWDFNTAWKPLGKVPLYFAWIGAVRRGQRKVRRGLNLSIPVLCLRSSHSLSPGKWSKNALYADTILNVKDIEKYAPALGDRVDSEVIPGGLHDVILSSREVREVAMNRIMNWILNLLPHKEKEK